MTAPKINKLKAPEMFKLNIWLKTNEAAMQGKTKAEIARLATQDLGILVKDTNITSAIQATGVKIGSPHSVPLGNTRNMVEALAAEFIAHLEKLGEVPSDRLKQLAGKA